MVITSTKAQGRRWIEVAKGLFRAAMNHSADSHP